MKKLAAIMVIALATSLVAAAQDSSPTTPVAPPSATQADKQSNAASATQDNSAISGDQVTKPAGAKSSNLTGCLSSPDSDGHFVLKSMQYRSGVEVLGPNDLGTAAGRKVKLTGEWVPESRTAEANSQESAAKKANRRFQATSFDILAEKCSPPAETTPLSKKKQKQKAAAANQNYPQ